MMVSISVQLSGVSTCLDPQALMSDTNNPTACFLRTADGGRTPSNEESSGLSSHGLKENEPTRTAQTGVKAACFVPQLHSQSQSVAALANIL